MFKFSIKLKIDEFDWNPTLDSMKKDYNELIEFTQKGKAVKAAYGMDKSGKVIKIAAVHDFKENEEAKNFLDGDGVETMMPLHNVKVEKLINDVRSIIERASRNEKNKEMKSALKEKESNAAAEPLESKEETSEIAVEEVEKPNTVVNVNEEPAVAEVENVSENGEETEDNQKARAIVELQRYGGKLLSDSQIQLAEGKIYKNPLIIELLLDDKEGGRVYRIIEIHDKKRRGEYSPDSLFKPSDLRKSKSSIEDHISNMLDDYTHCINNIFAELKITETFRLLKVSQATKRCNATVATTEEIWERLKEFLLNNPLDDRIMLVEIKGKKEIGIVGRANHTAYQNFRRLLEEIAPDNEVKSVKDEFRNLKLFITDKNDTCYDCQRTIPVGKKDGIKGDKMYSLNVGDKFIKDFEKAWNEAMKLQEVENESV